MSVAGMLTLRCLIRLISYPVPFPTQWVRMACAVLGVMAIGQWFGAPDVLTVKIAVAAAVSALILLGFNARLKRSSATVKRYGISTLTISGVMTALVRLQAQTVATAQYFVTGYDMWFALYAFGLFLFAV